MTCIFQLNDLICTTIRRNACIYTPSKVNTSKYPTYSLTSKYPTYTLKSKYTLRTLMNLINIQKS